MKLIYRLISSFTKMLLLVVFTLLLIPLCGGIYIFSGLFECSKLVYSAPSILQTTQDPNLLQKAQQLKASFKDYERPERNSFLSFPQWYPVYTAQAYAQHLEKGLPSHFPYFSAVKQFWQSYCQVHAFSRQQKQINSYKEHFILLSIGTGLTAQYMLKGMYEYTFGRLSEWTSEDHLVPEDQFAAQVAKKYASFAPTLQSTQFSFFKNLKALWQETPLWGEYAFRRWERKFVLSIEYAIRGIYHQLLEKSVQASLATAPADTKVWANEITPNALALPAVKQLAQISPNAYLLSLPRYQAFTTTSLQLFAQNTHYQDIAGNQLIMLSVLVPVGIALDWGNASVILTQPLLTHPQQQRIAVIVPVSNLPETIKRISQHAVIEHMYDY